MQKSWLKTRTVKVIKWSPSPSIPLAIGALFGLCLNYALPAGKPSVWKSVEVLIHGGVFKYRVSFRRWDGQTHQGWNLFNIDTLTLKYRDLLATMGGFDEVNEAEAMEAGDCIDCVKRTTGETEGFKSADVELAIERAYALGSRG
ncbi:hypothetical protein B0H13DRAFT_1855100 [Mycena leptocephala]|nr:hypothetical protein B0H13DRAFT_2307892 [Mycena leptocephala]KAJ7934497.1 hypothetical protein B0H13DRAFT_1855100 [Mycena leptocephala]